MRNRAWICAAIVAACWLSAPALAQAQSDFGKYFSPRAQSLEKYRPPATLERARYGPRYSVWSKKRVLKSLRGHGFYNFHKLTYGKHAFKLRAFKNGRYYRLHVSAFDGRIVRQYRIH
jgi:hypothetical protein